MHTGIKLRHLRAFLDVVAEGNLTAVARMRGISQPALSRTLQELELLLGQPLFDRTGRRLVLTRAGEVFRRHAALGLQALDTGAAALRPGGSGALAVGILPTVATRFFPQVALSFRAAHPEVTLSVATGPNTYLLDLLRRREIALMIGRMPSGELADLSFDHLYEDEVVLAARAGHPDLRQPLRQVLAKVPLILPPEDAIIRRLVEDFLGSIGLYGIRPAFQTVSLALGRGLLLGSDAVWFISRGVIGQELADGSLVTFATDARFLSGAVGMTRLQSRRLTPEAEALMQITLAAAGADRVITGEKGA